MSYRLMQIADMAERAAAAGWCITTLAEQNGVSVPTLERFFHDNKKLSPREWINAERMRRACACLMAGRNVQETSGDVGYESQHGFSLAFKKFFGYPPSLHRKMMEDGKWKSKVEGRESRASEGRARHSVRAEPPQHAKSEIGNRKSEIIVGLKFAFDKIKPNLHWQFFPLPAGSGDPKIRLDQPQRHKRRKGTISAMP